MTGKYQLQRIGHCLTVEPDVQTCIEVIRIRSATVGSDHDQVTASAEEIPFQLPIFSGLEKGAIQSAFANSMCRCRIERSENSH